MNASVVVIHEVWARPILARMRTSRTISDFQTDPLPANDAYRSHRASLVTFVRAPPSTGGMNRREHRHPTGWR
jgi:hypothetical protein